MKINKALRLALLLFFLTLLNISNCYGQCSPYLGQTFPENFVKRFPPDSLLGNAVWFYHSSPAFSPDGTEMYFTKYQRTRNKEEIWFTECKNGNWTTAKKAPFSNDSYTNNNPQFSPNKDTLYFVSQRAGSFIYKVIRSNGVWSSPIAINLPIPAGHYYGLQFSIAASGNIYSELQNAQTGDDNIYVWRFNNGHYSSPEVLSSISSPQLDFTPYIDPQERFIIFSSRRSGGYSNMDLYISIKKPDNTWSDPINLGQNINANTAFAPIITRDGLYFFFLSYKPDDLGTNPYWISTQFIYDLLTDIKDLPSQSSDFNLYQNYPNPFNPETVISYNLPESGLVSLKIYDILGKELTTLVNEEQRLGTYEVGFNASLLTSGVYFYQMTSGKYKETKKMILLQ
ncbi:MAG: T9SS type A sorting domain-containing protein [bacterium]